MEPLTGLGPVAGPRDWTFHFKPVTEGYSVFGCVADRDGKNCESKPVEAATVYRGGLMMAVLPLCETHVRAARRPGGVSGYTMTMGGMRVHLAR